MNNLMVCILQGGGSKTKQSGLFAWSSKYMPHFYQLWADFFVGALALKSNEIEKNVVRTQKKKIENFDLD